MLCVLWWNRCIFSVCFRWVMFLLVVEVVMFCRWLVLMKLWVLVICMKVCRLFRLFKVDMGGIWVESCIVVSVGGWGGG